MKSSDIAQAPVELMYYRSTTAYAGYSGGSDPKVLEKREDHRRASEIFEDSVLSEIAKQLLWRETLDCISVVHRQEAHSTVSVEEISVSLFITTEAGVQDRREILRIARSNADQLQNQLGRLKSSQLDTVHAGPITPNNAKWDIFSNNIDWAAGWRQESKSVIFARRRRHGSGTWIG